MDEKKSDFTTRFQISEMRDENQSPTSGSSSETFADEIPCKRESNFNRKQRRYPKRKRKWKPYNELTWDEKKVKDDRESRRAFAKRERLSAEGHPIAPYNTTQFLMDDRKINGSSPNSMIIMNVSGSHDIVNVQQSKEVVSQASENKSSSRCAQQDGDVAKDKCEGDNPVPSPVPHLRASAVARRMLEQKKGRFVDSPLAFDSYKERNTGDTNHNGEDIQNYIMDDFSHTYADIHAEQLQSMTKTDLIEECLKLEKRVDTLERRVKESKRRDKEQQRNQADVHLLEKINQLQVLNSQLQKENASIAKSASESQDESTMSNHGAQTIADTTELVFPVQQQESKECST